MMAYSSPPPPPHSHSHYNTTTTTTTNTPLSLSKLTTLLEDHEYMVRKLYSDPHGNCRFVEAISMKSAAYLFIDLGAYQFGTSSSSMVPIELALEFSHNNTDEANADSDCRLLIRHMSGRVSTPLDREDPSSSPVQLVVRHRNSFYFTNSSDVWTTTATSKSSASTRKKLSPPHRRLSFDMMICMPLDVFYKLSNRLHNDLHDLYDIVLSGFMDDHRHLFENPLLHIPNDVALLMDESFEAQFTTCSELRRYLDVLAKTNCILDSSASSATDQAHRSSPSAYSRQCSDPDRQELVHVKTECIPKIIQLRRKQCHAVVNLVKLATIVNSKLNSLMTELKPQVQEACAIASS